MKKHLWLCFVFVLMGIPPALANTVCSLDGNIDFLRREVNAEIEIPEKGEVNFKIAALSEQKWNLQLGVHGLDVSLVKLSTELNVLLEVMAASHPNEKTRVRGTITSQYSLIDGLPGEELSGAFESDGQKLFLTYFSVGGLSGSGQIDLVYPYSMNLICRLTEVPLSDFIGLWGRRENDLLAQGFVSGEINLSGSWDHVVLKGSLASYGGAVNSVEYDSVILNLEGVYPIVFVTNSTVTQTDGFTSNIAGSIDLSDTAHMRQQIASLKKTPLISEKDSSLEWTIKRKESESGTTRTELKYLLRKESKDSNPEDSGMFGVEHTLKF